MAEQAPAATLAAARRLVVKIGWMLLAAAIWGGVISALVTWWASPTNAEQLNQFDPGRFDLIGIVPVGYSLFAVALGVAAGALLRRVLPALAVTLAGFIAVRVVIALWLRSHYMGAVTVIYSVLSGYRPKGAFWQLASGVLGPEHLHRRLRVGHAQDQVGRILAPADETDAAGVHREGQHHQQVGDGRGLEDHRIPAWRQALA